MPECTLCKRGMRSSIKVPFDLLLFLSFTVPSSLSLPPPSFFLKNMMWWDAAWEGRGLQQVFSRQERKLQSEMAAEVEEKVIYLPHFNWTLDNSKLISFASPPEHTWLTWMYSLSWISTWEYPHEVHVHLHYLSFCLCYKIVKSEVWVLLWTCWVCIPAKFTSWMVHLSRTSKTYTHSWHCNTRIKCLWKMKLKNNAIELVSWLLQASA